MNKSQKTGNMYDKIDISILYGMKTYGFMVLCCVKILDPFIQVYIPSASESYAGRRK